jgi:hypothetical protein
MYLSNKQNKVLLIVNVRLSEHLDGCFIRLASFILHTA